MNLLDLFSGMGGFSLAASWAGIETVAFCEIDPFCRKVLEMHWPGVPKFSDIRQLTAGLLKEAGVDIAAIDIVSAGVPCQPASVAGKRKGTGDDRWLWPEALRIVAEVKPRWCLFENPTGILSLQDGVPFESVLSDLEAQGYETQAFIIPACAVGAPHRRDRVWIVAHSTDTQWDAGAEKPGVIRQVYGNPSEFHHINRSGEACASEDVANAIGGRCKSREYGGMARISGDRPDNTMQIAESGEDVSNSCCQGLQKPQPKRQLCRSIAECCGRLVESGLGRNFARLPRGMDGHLWPAPFGCEQYEWEPPRTAKGVPDRANRIKAPGNAIVPQVAYEIFRAIVAIEGGITA